jgi:hypothetical protein
MRWGIADVRPVTSPGAGLLRPRMVVPGQFAAGEDRHEHRLVRPPRSDQSDSPPCRAKRPGKPPWYVARTPGGVRGGTREEPPTRFILFVLIPGYSPFWPGALRPALWVAALIFTGLGQTRPIRVVPHESSTGPEAWARPGTAVARILEELDEVVRKSHRPSALRRMLDRKGSAFARLWSRMAPEMPPPQSDLPPDWFPWSFL